MAVDRYLITGGGTWVDSSTDIWHSLSNQAAGDGGGFTDGTDSAILDQYSGSLIVNGNVNPGTLDASEYLQTLTVNSTKIVTVSVACYLGASVIGPGTITVGGDFQLYPSAALDDTINITLNGTGNVLDASGAGGGNYDVNTTGTHTLGTDLYCHDWKHTAGTTVGTGYTIYCDGTFGPYTAGTVTGLSVVQSGTNNADWSTTNEPLLSYNVAASAVITLNNTRVATQAFAGSGTLNPATTQYLQLEDPTDNFWSFTGTITAVVQCILSGDESSGAAITLTDKQFFLMNRTAGHTLTMDGDLDVGSGEVYVFDNNNSEACTLDMNNYSLTGSVVLGKKAANTRNGILTLRGASHKIISVADGNASNNGNILNLDESYVEITGSGGTELDGTNITVTATLDCCHVEGLGAATIDNVSPDNMVHAHNCTDGGSNGANIDFDAYAVPGSLALMGVGV